MDWMGLHRGSGGSGGGSGLGSLGGIGIGGMFSADRNPFNVDDHHGSHSHPSMNNGLSPYALGSGGGPGGGGGVNPYITPPDRIRQDPLRLLFQQLQHDEHSGGLVDSPENALIYSLMVLSLLILSLHTLRAYSLYHNSPLSYHPL